MPSLCLFPSGVFFLSLFLPQAVVRVMSPVVVNLVPFLSPHKRLHLFSCVARTPFYKYTEQTLHLVSVGVGEGLIEAAIECGSCRPLAAARERGGMLGSRAAGRPSCAPVQDRQADRQIDQPRLYPSASCPSAQVYLFTVKALEANRTTKSPAGKPGDDSPVAPHASTASNSQVRVVHIDR